MKNFRDDNPPDALRRRLMLAMPAGLAIGSPFLFVGCGGGGGDASTPPAANPTSDYSDVAVTVTLPAGAATSGAKVATFYSSRPVSPEGRANATVLNGGPQWARVESATGRPLLLGWLGSGRSQLSVRSTAEVLAFVGIGGFLLPADLRVPCIDEIAAGNDLAALEAAIRATLAERAELDLRDPRIAAAIAALQPRRQGAAPGGGNRMRPLSVSVEPGGQVSGLSVLNEGLNQIRIQNVFRRRAIGIIERVAYKLPDGSEQSIDPPQEFWRGEVAPMTMSTSLIGTVGSALADWSTGGSTLVDNYTSAYTELSLTPASAEYTVYRVAIAGGGVGAGDTTGWTPDKEYLRIVTVLKTVAFDILVPLILGQVFPAMSDGKIPTPFPNENYNESLMGIATFVNTMLATAPDIWTKADSGDLTGAVLAAVGALVTDGIAQTALLIYIYDHVSVRVGTGGTAVRKLTDVLVGMSQQEFVAKAGSAFSIIGLVDRVLGAADLLLWAEGLARSNKVDTFTVKIAGSKMRLTPKAATVGAGSTTELSAQLLDPPSNPDALVTYQWTLTGEAGGTLRNPTSGTTGATLTTSTKTVDYVAASDATDGKQASISVEAILNTISDGGGAPPPPPATIATSQTPAVLTIGQEYTLKLLPTGPVDVPADDGIDVLALINEKIPDGATVEWQWAMAGPGSLGSPVTDRGPKESAVRYSSASTDGSARVSVRATIAVPATADKPAHSVITGVLTLTLNIKKGLRQIVMEVNGGVFGCTDPKACGVSEYTAFIVPRYAKAISYRAVLSGYAYPGCNRSLTWNSVVVDGGDCNFPVTYHPHSSQGATNLWAVWIGFGGPISGKCVVTITLAA